MNIKIGNFHRSMLVAIGCLAKGDLKNRVVIPLDNPFNSKETPIDRAELWIDPKAL